MHVFLRIAFKFPYHPTEHVIFHKSRQKRRRQLYHLKHSLYKFPYNGEWYKNVLMWSIFWKKEEKNLDKSCDRQNAFLRGKHFHALSLEFTKVYCPHFCDELVNFQSLHCVEDINISFVDAFANVHTQQILGTGNEVRRKHTISSLNKTMLNRLTAWLNGIHLTKNGDNQHNFD